MMRVWYFSKLVKKRMEDIDSVNKAMWRSEILEIVGLLLQTSMVLCGSKHSRDLLVNSLISKSSIVQNYHR